LFLYYVFLTSEVSVCVCALHTFFGKLWHNT